MNKKIEMLDNLTINKIAAGEMIEAPHSVVKELIENSIDAGASIITLEIKEGGKKYIRVTDNGIGISEGYVEQAFMRHSTSKITSIDDLNSILSLGFRGEALASIAAVSQVEMITRTADQSHGVMIEIIGGKFEAVKKVGCPVGTTVIVKNLFFNTPARLKFMKSNAAETMKISKIITLLSLSNPGITFKYINNNEIIFTTPGNNVLSQTILSVLDKDTFKNLIFLEEKRPDMKLWGYISQPNFVRGNRNLQIIYVNGRYIKNKLISEAIGEAYKEKVIINRYPVCILNLNIDPSETDINVHPSKTEIKFEREEQVQEFIYKSIAEALKKDSVIPKLQVTEHKCRERQISELMPISSAETGNPEEIVKDMSIIVKDMSITEDAMTNEIDEDYTKQSSLLDTLASQYKIIGQIFNTYIILEKEQSIYLIDQHAAHERLLYNKFLKEIEDESVVSQKLVEAKVLELSNEDYILLSDNMDLFIKLGFHIENFGINAIIIREVPMILGKPQDFSFLYEILDEMRSVNNIAGHFEDIIAKRACKKAIKARDKLDHYEIKQLIEELHTLVPPLTCPHGRPIILTMRQYDIEKHFKRIQ